MTTNNRSENTMTLTTEARNATLEDLAAILRTQQSLKLDVVAPATAITSRDGVLCIEGTDAEITDTGVADTAGRYRPTVVCDEGLAIKLDVPSKYLKRMRQHRPDLYDANVNGWLHGGVWGYDLNGDDHHVADSDPRSFLVRLFRAAEGDTEGVARAFVSNGFKRIDNFDVLTAALQGARDAGTEVVIDGCDLSERRMSVRLVAPEITALAPRLLDRYRSPFDQGVERAGGGMAAAARAMETYGRHGGEVDSPIVSAGVVIGNSETGGGKFSLTPRFVVKVCNNGLTMTVDAISEIHVGSRMDDGVVQWSDDTQQRNMELIQAQARDAMATFLNTDYLVAKIAEIEEKAGAPVTNPEKVVKIVGQRLRMTQDETDAVLAHFIMGGQMTAGGVVNAITSVAQTIADPDDAGEMEARALAALDVVAA